jgi:multiple sugar transport system ATP-binding protein
MAGLRVERLNKSFGKQTVLKDISFEVADGELAILLGPSGCGKSTLLRLIAGLEEADRGRIFVGGRPVDYLNPNERDIAMVFQSYALYPHLSAFDNLAFPLRIRKLPKTQIRARVEETAALLRIETLLDRKPKELSGGQRQRVAIGRAIVRQPSLFLFDEPLSNLDAQLRSGMRVELAKLHRKLGTTTIYVTHDQVEAMTLGQKIILLNKGEIQQIETPEEVYRVPRNLFAATFIGNPAMNVLEGILCGRTGGLFFQRENFEVDVCFYPGVEAYGGQNVSLGIRPEALIPGEGPLRAHIELVEHLGAEAFLYTRFQGNQLVARVSADFAGKPGQEIAFHLAPAGIHLFHQGNRIGS